MKIILLFFIALLSIGICNAQLVITNEPSATALAQQLVGPGVSISNVTFTGNSLMAGRFKNQGGLTNINIDSGIVLTSGRAKTILPFTTALDGDGLTQAQWSLADTDWLLPGDATLATEIGANIFDLYDAAVLEFDFIPSGDSVKFKYVFSSEEYTPAYVCTYNDAFAFFISGPGIAGMKNIALVPGTNIPVSILNVNDVDVLGGGCQSNIPYYQDNINNTYFTHDGHTVALIASSAVRPCNTYHLKLVISDFADGLLDSGVFLESKSLTSSVPPYLQSITAASTCGGSQLSVNFSEEILCNTVQNADFAVTGPGGPYTVTGWSSPTCTAGSVVATDITLTINPPIATNGPFQVCLTNISGSVTDTCGNVAPPACLNFNIATTIPIFNPIAPLCSGSVGPVLPTTSTNGVNGTWNPATVSNTTSGTYTFTPSTGQCAAPVSISITVTPGIVPTFNALAPICSGSTAPVLPATSINGINGTWIPPVVSNIISATHTFTPSAGQCAVQATLAVIVNSILISNTPVTICENELPYSWNGNSYPAAGSYPVTLGSTSGCDSIATLVLTANPIVASSTAVTICEAQLPYSWNGNSYSAPGSFPVTLTATTGCDSVATLILTTNPATSSLTPVTVCTNQLPYTWNGNNYPAAGTYSLTLTNSSGCDSVATLVLATNDVVTSSTPVTVCNNQLPYTWNGNSYPLPGTYSDTLIGSSGCDSIAILVLATNNVVTSSTDVTVCDNMLPYSWNGNSYPLPGTYSDTLTGTSGCDSIATLILTTNTVDSSSTPITVCENLLPYTWNGDSYPITGTYTVLLTSSSGCDSVATLILTVNPIVTSSTAVIICEAELPYDWNGNSYPAAGTFPVTLTASNGCDSVATLILTTNPATSSSTPVTVCANQLPYSWNGINYSAAGTYSLTLTNSSGCDSVATLVLATNDVVTSSTPVTVCNNQLPYTWNGNSYPLPGTYSVTLTGSSGCDSVATLVLATNNVVTSSTDVTVCDNMLPYSWNGNSYPLPGTYSDTLTGTSGCDSIATLVLTTNSVDTSSTPITVCENLLPYTWNGNSYPSGGTYAVTLTGSTGCDSVAMLILTSDPVVTSSSDTAICESQLPYLWNGNSYPAAGTYTITLTGSSGCDSLATLVLATNPVTSSSTPIAVCENQLPYTWNGNSYSSAGTYMVTLVSTTTGCDSVATLILSTNPVTSSSTPIEVCENQLPYNWNGNSYAIAGTYTVTLVSSTTACDSIATLVLTANDVVTSSTYTTICENQFPYNWNGNSYSAAGTYSVTLTSSSGCDSIATLFLSANSVVTSSNPVTICENQLPYTWNGNSYTAAGTYPVTLTGSSGCDSIATLILTSNAVESGTTSITICENLLPYSWNGNVYPAPGNYSVTLTGSNGCDSVATLTLFANAINTSQTFITICENQLPYSWNGNSYLAPGTYLVTLTGSAGCDSIATLILGINAVDSTSTAITICANDLPYNWNGNSYPAAGTYFVTLTNSSGCDSTATLVLAVNPVITSSTPVTICENQFPYNWNNNSYPAAGTYSVTLTGSSGCDSVATLVLTANPVLSSLTNIAICDNHLPYSWNSNTYPAAGTYSVTLTGSNGCDSVATLNLFVNPVNTSTTTANTCNNQLPYLWNNQSYNTGGSHTVTLSSSAGCDSIAILNLTIHPVKFSTTAASICSANLPYQWNGQSYNSSGAHVVTLTSAAGCDSVATLNLTINLTPAVPAVTSPVTYCQYDVTTALNAGITTPGSHLVWYTSPTGGTGSLSAPVPSSATAGSINYYVSQVKGPCEGPRAMITVKVNSKPALGPDKTLIICFGRSVNFGTLYNTAGHTVQWQLGQLPVSDLSVINVAGIYRLVVHNSFGCSDTAMVNLSIQPPVTADAGDDGNAEYNAPYQLSGSGGVHFQWSPPGLLNNPSIANPMAVLTQDATFVLMVKDAIGCMDYDTVKLKVLRGPTFYVPTAFSPNGDGLNDIFRPTHVGIQSLNFFRVFNRYGELVFETSELSKGWDGMYKGIKQNPGNYVWSLKGTDRKGLIKIMKGNVVLIR